MNTKKERKKEERKEDGWEEKEEREGRKENCPRRRSEIAIVIAVVTVYDGLRLREYVEGGVALREISFQHSER